MDFLTEENAKLMQERSKENDKQSEKPSKTEEILLKKDDITLKFDKNQKNSNSLEEFLKKIDGKTKGLNLNFGYEWILNEYDETTIEGWGYYFIQIS